MEGMGLMGPPPTMMIIADQQTSFIKEMIEESLYEYEEAYAALDRLNEKNSKCLTTEELEKELGL